MKKGKVLSALLLGGLAAGGLYWYGTQNKEKLRTQAEVLGDRATHGLLKGLCAVLPSVPAASQEDHGGFLPGQAEFRDTSKRGVRRSLGYARRSLLSADIELDKCYLGGYLINPPNTAAGIVDDLAVRAICMDDSSGHGAAVFAVLDTVGISLTDVRDIRERLKEFALEHNIVSINIAATHSHSAVDTQGLWGDLQGMLKHNYKALKENRGGDLQSGRNAAYMEHLKQQVALAVQAACLDMRKGQLYYAQLNDFRYAFDKRPPDVKNDDIGRLRFVPTDGSRETIGCFAAAHPVALGRENRMLSADYIHYMEEEVNKTEANFIFFQGAELSIIADHNVIPEEIEPGEDYQRYGRYLGRVLLGISQEQEEKVLPLLNVRCKEVLVPCNNYILGLAVRLGAVNNRFIEQNGKMSMVTEVGYVELGKRLRIAMVPGEMAPEILLGGFLSPEESPTREVWTLPAMKDMLAEGTNLKALGLCNDAVGYILPDNDFGSIYSPGRYEESVSAGKSTGSLIAQGFMDILEERGRLACFASKAFEPTA